MYSSSLSFRRRPERSRAGIWLGLFGLLLLLVVLGGPLAVAYLTAHPAREHSADTPAQLGLEFREVRTPAGENGPELAGWLMTAPAADVTVVMLHDYGRNRLQGEAALPLAKSLVQAGYNVFLYDQRGHGSAPQSTGSTFGRWEPEDLARVIAHLQSSGEMARHVVVMGWAMGANVGLQTAALDPEVEALILDTPTPNVRLRLDREIERLSPYPSFFFTALTRWMAVLFFGFRPAAMDPYQEIRRVTPRPVLLIQGRTGPGAALLSLSGRPGNELYLVPGAEPGQAYGQEPQAYAGMVLEFLRRNFPTAH